MNNLLILFLFFFTFGFCFAQDSLHEEWKSKKDYLNYRKDEKYKGPDDWYGSFPSEIKGEPYYEDWEDYSGIEYNERQLEEDREYRQRQRNDESGDGELPTDPIVQRPDPVELPEVEEPDADLPDIDPPTISPEILKVLLFILIATGLFLLAYLIVKNKQPSNKRIEVDVEDDWNPEKITKTELELRLENALLEENYREGIRVYFTFVLKELVANGWIQWQKEKTNYDYLAEMQTQSNVNQFHECVRIYDLVWYGDYKIDREIYELLEPTLRSYYKSITSVNG